MKMSSTSTTTSKNGSDTTSNHKEVSETRMASAKQDIMEQLNAEKSRINEIDFTLHNFTANDIRYQIPGLLVNSSVKVLKIPLDRLDVVSTKCIAMMLEQRDSSVGPPIEELHVTRDGATSESFVQIISSLGQNSRIKKLVVYDTMLDISEIRAIASILYDIKSLVSLVLRGCGIDHRGATKIACSLSSNKSLETLDLSNNPIGNGGISALAVALEINAHIKKLKLSGTHVEGENGGRAISSLLTSNSSIEVLNLSRNHLGDIGASKIAIGLKSNKSLKQLSLRQNSLSEVGCLCFRLAIYDDKNIETILRSNHTIRYLNIESNDTNDTSVANIGAVLRMNHPRSDNETISQKVASFLDSKSKNCYFQEMSFKCMPHLLSSIGKTGNLKAMHFLAKNASANSVPASKSNTTTNTVVESFFSSGDADNSTIATEYDDERTSRRIPDMIHFESFEGGFV